MARILLHICCGPCASACIERLLEAGNEVTLYFSNANIAPRKEMDERLAAARKLAKRVGVPLIEDTDVNHEEWLEKVAKGYEEEREGGARCSRCFAFNLARAAHFAAENGFELFTTSLTISPHKRSEMVFAAGRLAQSVYPNLSFLEENFKKHDGFKRSLVLSEVYGLYRQDYCGCEFSMRDRRRTPE